MSIEYKKIKHGSVSDSETLPCFALTESLPQGRHTIENSLATLRLRRGIMDDAGLDNVDAERIFLLEFHFFELRQNIPVGGTEGKMVDFIDADPAQVVVLQTLRGILCLCPKEG